MMLHGVLLYISEDNLSFFFAQFGEVADVSSVKSKLDIATEDIKIMVTVTRKKLYGHTQCANMWRLSSLCCSGRPSASLLVLRGRRASIESLSWEEARTTNPTNHKQEKSAAEAPTGTATSRPSTRTAKKSSRNGGNVPHLDHPL